jgi:uncharacterized protein (DUF2062 family)
MAQKAARARSGNGRHSRWERFRRLLRYRLVVPIKRSHHHPPEHTARGVMVGLGWALTPTIGIQMGLCLITWLFARRLFRWDFSLIVSCAWTWTTNVVTMLPCYYIFYVTGQLLLGRFDHLSGYDDFLALWQRQVGAEEAAGSFDWFQYFEQLAVGWGLPLLVGSLPWAVVGAWLGYVWTLRFVRRHREARHRRRLARRGAAQPHSHPA